MVANVGPSDPQLAAALERILELDTELQAARRSIADLTTALETNRDIGAAIGIVMVTRGVSRRRLSICCAEASQSRHTKLRDVAREVVALRGLASAPVAPAPRLRKPAIQRLSKENRRRGRAAVPALTVTRWLAKPTSSSSGDDPCASMTADSCARPASSS